MPISIDNAAQAAAVQPAAQSSGPSAAETQAKAAEARQALAEAQAEAQVKAAKEAASRPSPDEVQAAAKDLSDYINVVSRSLSISVDRDLQTPVVSVVDVETKEVVRQIPNEEVIRVAKYIRSQMDMSAAPPSEEALTGILLNQQS